jgi:predicted Rossmann-fold nucleotide-binding protein
VLIFPGGFGTLDELFELLTLVQTKRMTKPMPIVLFGTKFWDEVVNFDALVKHGTISAKDISLVRRTDSVDEAYQWLVKELTEHMLQRPGAIL